MRGDPIEFVNYRVSAIGTFAKPDLLENAKLIEFKGETEKHTGTAVFDGKEYQVSVINRNSMKIGDRITGPAIIAEMGATSVVYPNHTAEIDDMKNIVMYTNLNA
jgi:N-methylhydantoinase A/oxoprolinase/acetone carboxylase beta subunit